MMSRAQSQNDIPSSMQENEGEVTLDTLQVENQLASREGDHSIANSLNCDALLIYRGPHYCQNNPEFVKNF